MGARFRYNKPEPKYKGWKGYNEAWGRHIGILSIMVYYLQYVNIDEYTRMDKLLRHRTKRGTNELTQEEMDKHIIRVWKMLPYDLQRKLEKSVMFILKDYKRYYNV